MIDFGIVYILKNKYMPSVYKIGLTRGPVADRIKSLRSTSLPIDFEIVKCFESEHCMQLERYIHKKLSESRVSCDREFFYAYSDEVIVSLVESYIKCFTPKSYTEKERNKIKSQKKTGDSTPDKRAKQLGAESLKRVAEVFGCTVQNLRHKHKHKPHQFDIIVLGVVNIDTKRS